MKNSPSKKTTKKVNWYTEVKVKTWDGIQGEIKKHFKNGKKWLFRGDCIDKKCPKTSIEKAFELYKIKKEKEKHEYEIQIIREFQRRAFLYMRSEPDKNDYIEWLALMQHHGAPTRFLDWTYSFYVALYFALARNKDGVIWAINGDPIAKTGKIKEKIQISFLKKRKENEYNAVESGFQSQSDIFGIRKKGEKIEDLVIVTCLLKEPMPLVYAVNPFRLNKRLTTQQGVFIALGDSAVSFEKNIKTAFENDKEEMRKNIYKITFAGTLNARKKIVRELKQMNITNETLFPGLDGLAQFTTERLALRSDLWPKN